jgi:hypothetical protein
VSGSSDVGGCGFKRDDEVNVAEVGKLTGQAGWTGKKALLRRIIGSKMLRILDRGVSL